MVRFFMERKLYWEDSPQKKCVSLGNPFFFCWPGQPCIPCKKNNKDLQKKLQLWNFRPPWSFANHCSDRKARSTFDPLVMQGQERADGRLSAADLYHLDTILLFSRNFLHASLWCQHNFLGSWFFRKVLTSLVDPVSLFKEASVWILSEVISPLYTIHPESREVSPSHKNRCAVSLW